MAGRNSMLCPNCSRLISADETRCPYCGLRRPNSLWKRLVGNVGLRDPHQLVYRIIGANVVVYLLAILLNPVSTSMAANPFTFLAPDDRSLLMLGMTGKIPIDRFGRWWSLLAANYLHSGILHIFFNMVAFRQLAPLVIREFGTYRMFVIYTLGGVGGFVVSYLVGIGFTIGASAAVCALIGAALYFGKSRGGSYGATIYRQVGTWVVVLFIFGFLVPGINNWGHGGGIVFGALLGYLLGYEEIRRERLIHRLLGAVCLFATVAVLLWAVLSSFAYRFLG